MSIHFPQYTFSQKGRSMLEMLAILAVIAIMVTALLAGFTYAMNKNRANTIAKDVVLRAAAISTDPAFSNYGLNTTIGALGFKAQDGRLTYTQTKITTTRFAIDVSPVSEGICKRLAEGNYASAVSVSVNDNLIQPGNVSFCGQDNNKLTFVYDAVIHGAMLKTYECGACYKKSGDDCVYACEGAQICTDGGCACPAGTPGGADSITCTCPGDFVPNADNVCACPSNQVSAGDNKCKCPDPITQWDGGKCVCPDDTPTGADPTTCACYGNKVVNAANACVCEGNKTDPDNDDVCTCPEPITYWNGTQCVCPDNQTLSNGHCCPSPTTYWNGSACVCPDNQTLSNGHCCPNPTTYWNGSACVCPNGQTLSNGHCCPTPTTYWNGSTCVCPDDKVLTNGVCCPSGQVGSNGHCCSEPTTYWNGTACVCPNNQTLSNGHCCPSPTTYWNGTACVCPNNQTLSNGHCCPAPTTYWNGSACVCPTSSPIGHDVTTCVCPSGSVNSNNHCCASPQTYWNGSTCVCPSGTPANANPNTCQCYAGQTLTNNGCCSSPRTYWNGSACVCPSDAPSGHDTTTCACPAGANLNTATNTCVTCTSPKTQWDAITNQCVCPTGAPTGHDANTCQCPVGQINMNGTCGTCPAPTTYWNGSACVCPTGTYLTTMSNGSTVCLPYCEQTNTGLFLLVDRSGSTTGTVMERINASLNSLNFPLQGNTALYHQTNGSCNQSGKAIAVLPYGSHTQAEFDQWFNVTKNVQCANADGTYFHTALQDIAANYCTNGAKIIIALWTDAELGNGTDMKNALITMKNNCDVHVFFISKNDNDRSYITGALDASQYQFFTFEDTSSIQTAINNEIQDQLCIRPDAGFNPYAKDAYVCNRLQEEAPARLFMTESQCNLCGNSTTFWNDDSNGSCWGCNRSTQEKTTQAQCYKCANRVYTTAGQCMNCNRNPETNPVTTQADCNRCPSSAPRFWRASDGKCFSCNDGTSQSKITADECNRCPNRTWTDSGKGDGLGSCKRSYALW